jgi:hypothetical protein
MRETKMTALTGVTDFAKKQPWLVALVSLVIGLIIGLTVLGWLVFPVKWVNAGFADLHPSFKQEYVRIVADAYGFNLDQDLAAQRIAALGPSAGQVLSDTIALAKAKNPQGDEALLLEQLKAVAQAKKVLAPPEAKAQPSVFTRFGVPLLLACVVVLLVGGLGGLLYLRTLGQPRGGRAAQPKSPAAVSARISAEAPKTDYTAPGAVTPTGAPPVARFMTTYTLGDDVYDDSFSIDGPDGNFLGECGMGISETIGVGDPKKVTAFEVWLFDKNDIRTVTKVVMSEHAFRDEGLKSRLAAKGEPVQAASGDTVQLETATLIVTARVVDMAYGGGALPPNSFFERLTIELAAFKKPATS